MAAIIFGGAFDPPHIEHKKLLKAAVRELKADSAVIVPTYLPPHKSEGFLSFKERSELAKIAFDDIGAELKIDDIEERRGGDNYACEVLPILKEKYGDIIYLIGGDSLHNFLSWYKPEKILECCPLAVARREGYDNTFEKAEQIRQNFHADVKMLDFEGRDVSSAIIKAKLLLGEEPEELDGRVLRYIKEKGLFEEYADMINKLRCYQSPELFEHSKYVVLRAIDFNCKHNLKQSFEKVFVAALLHDNAKERLSLDGLDVPADSIESPVLHQFLGAEKAMRDFGITDKEILNAIRYHTTARADMSVLEKLIYTSDSLSEDRRYEPIPQLRKKAEIDFDDGFKSVLKYTYLKVMRKGKGVYPLTEEAKRYYLK